MRKFLNGLATEYPGVRVVAETESGTRLLDLCLRHQPALAIIGIDLVDQSGFEAVRGLRQIFQGCYVVLLSHGPDPCVEEVGQMIGAEVVCNVGDLRPLRDALVRCGASPA